MKSAAEPCRPPIRYLLITACRDEEQFARKCLESVVHQSLPPTAWIIVDDGSVDSTPSILTEYAARHDAIKVIRRPNRGRRSVGPGVVEAFYVGYAAAQGIEYEYLCKLDLDIELPSRYFETLLGRMEAEPRLGTCSGKPYFVDPSSGEQISERCGDEMSVGMTKLYRRRCFEEIGGFVPEVMWDGIDCHRCRMHGWIACSWDEPDLRFLHLRPMGSSQHGICVGRARHGYGQYFMGTHPLYMLSSGLYRMRHPPVVVGGLAMLWGYLKSWIRGLPRYNDPLFRRFLRRYQWSCLLRGKSTATRLLDARQRSVWLEGENASTSRWPECARGEGSLRH